MPLKIVRKADFGPQDAPELTPEQQYGQIQIADKIIQATGSAQSALEAALANVGGVVGDVASEVIIQSLSLKAYQESLAKIETPLLQQIVNYGNKPIEGLAMQADLTMTNPDAIAMARKQAGDLAVQLSREQHDIIRNLTALAVAGQFDIPTLGIKLRNHIGLHTKWAKAVENRYESVYNSYLKQGFDTSTAQVMAKKASADYHARLVRKRALTIARTEVLRAENDGRWLGWKSAIAEGYADPNAHKRWIVRPVGACEICQSLNGTVVPWDQPFGFGQQMPPRHPNCRCTALLVPPPADYKPATPPKDLLNPTGYDDKGVFIGNPGGAIPTSAPEWAKPVAWNGQLDIGDIIYFDGMKGTAGYEIASKSGSNVYYKTPTGTTAINVGDLLSRGKAVAIVPGVAKLSKVTIAPDAGAYKPAGAPNNAIAVNLLTSIHAGDTLYTSTLKPGQSMTVIMVDEVNLRLKVMGTTGSTYWTPFNPTKNQYAIVPTANKVKSLLGMPPDNVATPKAPVKTATGEKPAVSFYQPQVGEVVAVMGYSSTFQITKISTGASGKKYAHLSNGSVVLLKNVYGLPVGAKIADANGKVYAVKEVKGNLVITQDGLVLHVGEIKPAANFHAIGSVIEAPTPEVKPITPNTHSSVIDASVVLGKQTGKPGGSNTTYPSGFWRGTDGVDRYVKLYKDPEQAISELIANELYAQLGVQVPKTSIAIRFNPDTGKNETLIVTEIVKNKGTVGDVGLTKANATEIVDGFIADVWLANYDAVGTGLDNVVVTNDGTIARIDQGGSLLFRAMGSKKTGDLTNADPTGFYDSNAYYRKVFDKVGLKPLELDPRQQLARIDELVAKHGSVEAWLQSIVDEVDFGLTAQTTTGVGKTFPAFDVKQYAKMLEGRKAKLEQVYKFNTKTTPRTPQTTNLSTNAADLQVGQIISSIDPNAPETIVKITSNVNGKLGWEIVDTAFTSDIGKTGEISHASWAPAKWKVKPNYEPKVKIADMPSKSKGTIVYDESKKQSGVIVGKVSEGVYIDFGQGNEFFPTAKWDEMTESATFKKPPVDPVAFEDLKVGMSMLVKGVGDAPISVYVTKADGEGVEVTTKQFNTGKGVYETAKTIQVSEQSWQNFMNTKSIDKLAMTKPPKTSGVKVGDVDAVVGSVFTTPDESLTLSVITKSSEDKYVVQLIGMKDGIVVKEIHLLTADQILENHGDMFLSSAGGEQPTKPLFSKAAWWEPKKGALTGVADTPGVTFKVTFFSKATGLANLVDEAGNVYKGVPIKALTGPAPGLPFYKKEYKGGGNYETQELKVLEPAKELSGKPGVYQANGGYFKILMPDGTIQAQSPTWSGDKWYTEKLAPKGVVPKGWIPGKYAMNPADFVPKAKAKPSFKVPLSLETGSIVAHSGFPGNTYKIVGKTDKGWQIETATGAKFVAGEKDLIPIQKGVIIKNGDVKVEIMSVYKEGTDFTLNLSDGTSMSYSTFLDNVSKGTAGIANTQGSKPVYLAGNQPSSKKTQAYFESKVSYGVPYSHEEGALAFGNYSEGTEWGKRAFADWRKAVAAKPEQVSAISNYTGSVYGIMNKYLRDGGSGKPFDPKNPDPNLRESTVKYIVDLKEALDSAELTSDVIVNRGISSVPDETLAAYRALQPGDLIYDGAFQSSSVGPDAAFTGPVVLRIRLRAGDKGAYLANLSGFNDREREFLIQAGTTMKVVQVHNNGSRYGGGVIIDLEVVDQNPFGGVPDPSKIAIFAVSKALFFILSDLTLGKVSA